MKVFSTRKLKLQNWKTLFVFHSECKTLDIWMSQNHSVIKSIILNFSKNVCDKEFCWKVTKIKGCITETLHFWPHHGKAKMYLSTEVIVLKLYSYNLPQLSNTFWIYHNWVQNKLFQWYSLSFFVILQIEHLVPIWSHYKAKPENSILPKAMGKVKTWKNNNQK